MADPAPKKTAAKKESAKAAPAKKTEKPAGEIRTYHISFDKEKDKWGIKAEENTKVNKYFRTKEEAEEYAKDLKSKNANAKIIFHKMDGKFQKSH